MAGSPILSLFDLYTTQATYSFSDQELEAFPTYRGNLVAPINMTKALPDLFVGIQEKRSAQIQISNINNAIGTDGSEYGTIDGGADAGYGDYPYGGTGDPTISEITSAEDIRGKRGRARAYDVEKGTAFFTLHGVITEVRKTASVATLTLESIDNSKLTDLIPKTRILDIYPNADITTVRDQDPPVLIPFGEMRKADLALVTYSQTQYGSTYDYGLVRKPRSGSYWTVSLYRDNRVISSADYSLIESPTNYYIYRFTLDQRDISGRLMRIQADIGAQEFMRPSQGVNYVLTQELGGTVLASSLSEANTIYANLSARIAGGLYSRRPAGDVLNDLLLHGAVLDSDAGIYTITVDQASLHTAGTPQLGLGDNNWENIFPDSITDESARIEERIRKLTLNGLFDPGFEGSGSYLMRATRFRDIPGAEREESSPFAGNEFTLDMECDYRFKRLKFADRKITLKANLETRDLDLNKLVKVYIPNMGFGGDEFEIRGMSIEGDVVGPGQTGESRIGFSLSGYSSAAFTYQAGVVQSTPAANTVIDYSFTPPGAVTGFAVTSTDATNVYFKATAPSTNVTHLVFQIFSSGSAIPYAQNIQPVSVSETRSASFALPSGGTYQLQCYARNVFNKPGFQDGVPSVI